MYHRLYYTNYFRDFARDKLQLSVWNPTVHMILKSDLKMAQTSARCIPHLLFEDYCGHNQASYNCKHSGALSNSYDVRRWVRPIAGEMSAQTSLLDFFP